MIEFNKYLVKFRPVTLEEIDSVKFMNRIDTKYIFQAARIPDIFELLPSDYHVLEIGGKRQFRYATTYLDTPDLCFYSQHVTGKLGRYKVRVRSYETGDVSFLEVKKKTNKGRTVKSRIKTNETDDETSEENLDFLREKIPMELDNLSPVLTNDFSRITFVNFRTSERITFDFNLSFTGNNGGFINMPYLAIAEIKHDRSTHASPFVMAMKKMGIRQMGFSKYCVGLALLYDVPKKNMIKQKILILNKLKDEPGTTVTY